MKRSILRLIAAAVVLAIAFSSRAATGTFKVTADLSHAGKVFGTPVMVVKNGVLASVRMAGPHGQDYRLVLTVIDLGHGKLKLKTHLQTRWGKISPLMIVRLGKPASASVGAIKSVYTVVRVPG